MHSALTHTVARCPNDENFPIPRVRRNAAERPQPEQRRRIVVRPLRASHYVRFMILSASETKAYASKSAVARLAAMTRPQRRRRVIVHLLRTSRLGGLNMHGTT